MKVQCWSKGCRPTRVPDGGAGRMGSFQALAGYKRLLYGAETSKHTQGESCWCQMCKAWFQSQLLIKWTFKSQDQLQRPCAHKQSSCQCTQVITTELNIVFQSCYVWPDHFKLCEDDENILDASARLGFIYSRKQNECYCLLEHSCVNLLHSLR